MDKEKYCKRFAIWAAVITAALVAIVGLCFGRVIEGTLFAEVAKWIVMTAVLVGIVECFVYFLAPLIWHFRNK